MRTGVWLLGAVLGAGIGGSSAAAQDKEARAVLDKALKAHGGADKLSRFTASHLKAKGSMELMNMTFKFTVEVFVERPDKIRSNVEIDFNGKAFPVIDVYDGKKAWQSLMGKTVEIKDAKKLAKHRDDLYFERVASLAPLAGKEFELALIGESKVKDEDAVGIRVTSKDRPDVNLYFAKKTGLLIKTERRSIEPITEKEVNQEDHYGDYKETDGVPSPQKMAIYYDGKLFMDMELIELRHPEKIDPALFAQP